MASFFKIFPETKTVSPKVYPLQYCIHYPHNDIVNSLHTILLDNDDNISSVIISWIFVQCLLRYKKYTKQDVQLISGRVRTQPDSWEEHMWVYDKKENYYIDIASQRFLPNYCLCSQDFSAFTNYIPYETVEDLFEIFKSEYDDDFDDLFEDKDTNIGDIIKTVGRQIRKGGKKSKRKLHHHRKTNRRFV